MIATRSGAVQHSRYHPVDHDHSGILSEETLYPLEVQGSVPFGLPKSEFGRTHKFYKKEKQNSFELAEPRLPTACFGSNQKPETESYATQVVDSYPNGIDCGAKATQEIKRKLYLSFLRN